SRVVTGLWLSCAASAAQVRHDHLTPPGQRLSQVGHAFPGLKDAMQNDDGEETPFPRTGPPAVRLLNSSRPQSNRFARAHNHVLR
ncbi:MAG: hypothetical protein KC442_18990, partial [Thermomicrobiales bacterium]|nr:hypothetical protein [Thermomicrobiales bacterium]